MGARADGRAGTGKNDDRRRGVNFNQGGIPMSSIVNRAKAFLKSEDGPTATEYAVMLALIIVVCIASIKAIGPKADAAFKSVGDNM